MRAHAHTYLEHLSLKYSYIFFFSLKRYLFKHRGVPTSTKGDLLKVLATNHISLASTKYKLSITLAIEYK